MKKREYKDALNSKIDQILDTTDVTLEQKRSVVNQMIINLNNDVVNPDHVKHPVIKG